MVLIPFYCCVLSAHAEPRFDLGRDYNGFTCVSIQENLFLNNGLIEYYWSGHESPLYAASQNRYS